LPVGLGVVALANVLAVINIIAKRRHSV